MRQREDDLWGTSGTYQDDMPVGPGKVTLSIDAHGVAKSSVDKKLFGDLAYGAFSTANLWHLTGSAKLVLELSPDVQSTQIAEVQDALDSWLLFGAIGGRTRRGFGAVHCARDLPPVEEFLRKFSCSNGLDGVPSLHGAQLLCARQSSPSARSAHEQALGAMKKFRQGSDYARNRGEPPKAGRSRWPEPDEIRRIARRNASQHRPEHPVHAFPRAAFGMPIVFHFKDQGEPKGEPKDHTLLPRDAERMASPLVLRPVFVGGAWKAGALRLTIPNLVLSKARLQGVSDTEVRVRLEHGEPASIHPLRDMGDLLDPIAAFMKFLSTRY
jgi:CRISPR-associated protein Cmr1